MAAPISQNFSPNTSRIGKKIGDILRITCKGKLRGGLVHILAWVAPPLLRFYTYCPLENLALVRRAVKFPTMNRREFIGFGAAALAGGAWVSTGRANAPDSTGRLRILFFTDLHARDEGDVPARMMATALRIAAADADVIIGGGDLVHGGFGARPGEMAARFALARKFVDEIGRPVVLIPGNHDFVGARPDDGGPPEADPLQLFRETFGVTSLHATWEVNGYRIFRLQSVVPVDESWRYEGRISDDQLQWLDDELSRISTTQPLILCTHIPMQTTFKQVQESPLAALPPNLVVANAQSLLDRFANHNLRLVLQGHLHVNELIQWNNRTFLMGGAVSGAWWNGPNLGTPPGYGVVTLDKHSVQWDYAGHTTHIATAS